MKAFGTLRGWHAWLSVILALPILLVSVTAIFIAHDKSLGLKEIPVNARWLPGYSNDSGRMTMEIRSHMVSSDGTPYLGSRYGLFRVEGGTMTLIPGSETLEVRSMVEQAGAVVIASKNGLFRLENGTLHRVSPHEIWSLSQLPDGAVAALTRDDGILRSDDGGKSWKPHADLNSTTAAYAATMPERPLTLANLVMDLHTGKAFFSKETQWLWIDLTGAVMTFLGVSGLVVWWRTRRRKAQAAMAQAKAALDVAPATRSQAVSP